MSHDPELIERCAKALCDNMDEQQGLWSELGPKGQEEFRSLVRAVLDEAAKSVPVAAPEPDGPMREGEWSWWAGTNDEMFAFGPHKSREDAIEEARNDCAGEVQNAKGEWVIGVHLVEATNPPLRLAQWAEADRLLELAEEGIFDSDRVSSEYDDGPFFECTQAQENDLITRVKRACDEWQAAHGLVFTCHSFQRTRNKEYVEVAHPRFDPAPVVSRVPGSVKPVEGE